MATSDEPPPAGLAGGLSRGAWGAQSFDVVRRSPAPPFWNSAPPPPQSSNFLDLNAPFEEDPQPVSRGLPNFMDHLGSGVPSEGTISFLNPAKDSGGDGLRSFIDASGSSRNLNQDADEASAARDQEPPHGQDTGPFVDYLSQFSGKKEGDVQEKERSKPAPREVSEFPDELLSLSSSYHKKRGESGRTGRPPADGAALFLASGRGQDSPHLAVQQESRNAKEQPRPSPMGVNFGSHRLDDISSFREVEKSPHGGEAQPGVSIEERSLFPRNAVHMDRNDIFYSMPNIARDERTLMSPSGSARETLDLSNNLSFKDEKFGMSRQTRVGVESSKEGMSLSLKRPYEESDAAEEYKRRREEESVQASLYSRHVGEGRDGGDENPDVVGVSHMKRRRDRPGGEEQRFQNDHKRVQNDQNINDDKPIVWPPVVIIENTRLSWDEEKKKWKGLSADDIRKSLRNAENWEYAKAKCLFDIHGQKSSALVVFPPTFEGYFEAETLHEQLQRSGKGRDQWMKVRPQDLNPRSPRSFNTPDLVSQDGKRILYGFLAQPEDIQRADPQKGGVKWSLESFNEKVRKPAQQRHQMTL
jgi:hypothetical protein